MTSDLRDVTGSRGEKIVELRLTDYQSFPEPLFHPTHLGDIEIRMSKNSSQASLIGRRAELMAELFFQSLDAAYVARFEPDLDYDLVVGFLNPKGGIDNLAVEVKATKQVSDLSFRVSKKVHDRLAYSNTPAILLVADVKHNRLYYAWLRPNETTDDSDGDTLAVRLTEIDDAAKTRLRAELASQRPAAIAA